MEIPTIIKNSFIGAATIFVASAIACAEDMVDIRLKKAIQYDQLLEKHQLTGLSVAVIDNYELVHLIGAGEKDYGTGQLVDPDTAFSTASVSKAITGLIAVMLVEQGVLDLDKPVSVYLKRWSLPESDFNKYQPITLRHLLTHTAGTSQSGFADYYPGDDIPTLIESLNGEKLARYKEPITIMWEPRQRFKYSGGGFVVAQVAIEDVTGKTLPELAREMLFDPLGMQNTTMHQVGHQDFPKNVAKAHAFDRSHFGDGGVLINPQQAAGGVWSSAADMAKLVLDMQKALAKKPSKVISPWVAKTVTSIQTFKKAGGWGLGWARYEAQGNLDWFSHLGYNTGIGGAVMGSMEGGKAIIAFGNGVHRVRVPAINEVIATTIKTLGWKREIQVSETDIPDEIRSRIVGHYRNLNTGYWSPFHEVVTIEERDGALWLDNSIKRRAPRKLIHIGEGRFKMDEFNGSEITIEKNPSDQSWYLTMGRKGMNSKAYALRKLTPGYKLPYDLIYEGQFDAALAAYKAWKQEAPESSLLTVRNLLQEAAYAAENNQQTIAKDFYRIALHFYPENSEVLEKLKAL
ncbi:serine hydrolase domain-containing protein [Kordiimonas laminariae]|uniref:serine hydrolase domain-containing protein n=1 Tax=Kordiimonas laminariae TaxID=2917717 RepID=UPI001FF3DB2B|nr:serine hydrolase domain-containing protein [Kordiimonas laminariae]MCK0070307.1 beta-lactamase family protein [Kordiimonas laminariae]